MDNLKLEELKNDFRPTAESVVRYYKEQKTFSNEEILILNRANTITASEFKTATQGAKESWNLVGERQLMPELSEILSCSLHDTRSLLHPLMLMLPDIGNHLSDSDFQAMSSSLETYGAHYPILKGESIPVHINGEYLNSCRDFNITNYEGAHSLLESAIGVPFSFYIPAGSIKELSALDPGNNVGDCLVTIKFTTPATWKQNGETLWKYGSEAIPNGFTYPLLRRFLVNVQKLDLQLSNKLAQILASSIGMNEVNLSSLSKEDISATLMLGAARGFLEMRGLHLPNDTDCNEDTLIAQISIVGLSGDGHIVKTSSSESVKKLLTDPEDFHDNVSRLLMNMIMVEIATSGCYKSLTYEHSLGKSEAPVSKRKQKKQKKQPTIKGPLATTSIPIKRYGEDLAITIRTASSTKEWKGGRLIRAHWRRPHMSTRLKGKGPDKRKEQVLVKGCLVTGEGARLQREKRAALKPDTPNCQMPNN